MMFDVTLVPVVGLFCIPRCFVDMAWAVIGGGDCVCLSIAVVGSMFMCVRVECATSGVCC